MLKAKGEGGKGRFKPWDVGRHHQYEFLLVQEGIMRTQDHFPDIYFLQQKYFYQGFIPWGRGGANEHPSHFRWCLPPLC